MKLKLWILPLLSAILLSIPYLLPNCGFVSFIAFIPLFAAEYIAQERGKKFFFINYYLCFLIWNIATTYWIYLATVGGAIAAIVLNALQIAIIFRLFRFFKKRVNNLWAYFGFAFLWVAWEHLYYTWQVSWPWLTLGNAFATNIKSIQWYEITGTLGGSLWILIINILLYKILMNIVEKKREKRILWITAIFILAPVICSHIRYYKYESEEAKMEKKQVVVLQPNIDPYNEKFLTDQASQDEKLLNIANQAIDDSTFLLVAPETFFNPSAEAGRIVEDHPNENKTFSRLKNYAVDNSINLIYGAVTYRFTYSDKQPNVYAFSAGYNVWGNTHNSAIFINNIGNHFFYHKSKLVILAESTPIVNKKPLFKSLGIDLGGAIGNFTPQQNRTIFKTKDETIIGSAICYESVFGDFYREYIQNGAQIMTIITNDGWWGNTPGHIQHLHYASLRAIETRRSIARSANTGISALINQRGEIVAQSPWWEPTYIKGEISVNKKITPFVKYGDVVGRLSCYISLLMLLAFVATYFKRKRTV